MIKKVLILTLLFLLLTNIVFSQCENTCVKNFFSNPSFECYSTCPTNLGQINYADDWFVSVGDAELMVNGGSCVYPRPALSWSTNQNMDSGSHGQAWMGFHTSEAVTQDLDYEMITGDYYSICFDAAISSYPPFVNKGDLIIQGINKQGSLILLSNNAARLGSVLEWEEYCFSFICPDTLTQLRFSLGGDLCYAYFDNFRVTYDKKILIENTCFEDQTNITITDTSDLDSLSWHVENINTPLTPIISNSNWDGNTVQFSNPGTYSVRTELFYPCYTDTIYDTVNIISVSPINLGNDTTICNDSIILQVDTSLYDYVIWNNQITRAKLVVDSSQEIYVEVGNINDEELILNGDFELGDVGFTSDYTPGVWPPDGRYSVNNSTGPCPDHTTGTGSRFVAGGTGAYEKIWCQKVDIKSNSSYLFSFWSASSNGSNPTTYEIQIDGTIVSSSPKDSASTCQWIKHTTSWQSSNQDSVEICIWNTNNSTGGNDFNIDDISFRKLCTKRDTIYIGVPSKSTPSIVVQNTCFEDQTIVSLIDSIDVDSVNWNIYNQLAPLTSVFSSSQIIDTVQFSQSGFHYITAIAYLGCKKDTIVDTFRISQINPIDLGNDTVLCVNDSILLDAGPGYDFYLWNDGDTSRFKMADSSGEYYVKASVISDNIVINGDFERGINSIDFATDYNYGPPASGGFLTINASTVCAPPNNTGTNTFLDINGSCGDNGVPGSADLWCQTHLVTPNTDYIFSAWFAGQASVGFFVNGSQQDVTINTNGSSCSDWQNNSVVWNSGNSTFAKICVNELANSCAGSDFYIDEISFIPLCSKFDTINVTIQSDSIKLNCLASDLKCNNDNSGSIEVNPTGSSGTGYQYQIDADAFQDSSNTYADLAANTYTITVTDDAGCTNDTSISLSEPLALSLSTVSTKDTRCFDLCDGEILLSSSGGTSPFVFTLDASISSSGTDSLFNALCDGSYLASVIDSNLCIDSFSIIINEPTELSISSSVIDTCVDNAVNVSINVSGGTLTYDYLWNGASLSSSENIIVSSDSIISVYVIDDSLCHSDTIDITINKSPTLDFIVDSISCNGLSDGSILVTPSGGGSTYQYSVDASPFASSNSIGSLSAGNHTLSVTDERSCVVDTTFQVFEPLPLVASIANQLNALCKDSCDGEVELTSTGGISPISFTLDGNTPDIAPATFNGLCDGTYSAVASDNNGCQNTISVVITEPNALTVSFPSDTCLLLPTGLVVTGSGGTISSDYTYIWNQNNNITGNGINAWSNQLDTVYSVFIIDDNLCVSPSIDINVHIVPTIDYILSNDTTVTYGDQLELVALGGYQYSWSPSDVLDNPTDNKPIASPSETTTFQLDIVVGQCITTDTVLVNVIQGDLFIPNIFSPDGDGFNDIFRIRGAIFDEFEMNIFNRWGEKVFDSKNQFEGWDGTFRNQDAQEGVYGFIILGTTNQGTEVKQKGNITLMR